MEKATSLTEAEDNSSSEGLDASTGDVKPQPIKPIESGVFSGLSRSEPFRPVASGSDPVGHGPLESGYPSARSGSGYPGAGHSGSGYPTSARSSRPARGGAGAGDDLVDSLQTALSAASSGEAGLSSLHRSLRDASRSLTASRHAHQSLTDELRVLYRGLNEVMSEKAAVERYAALLTQERDAALDAAEEARREAKREKEFLLREQDRFIQLLLEEHEAELQQLKRRLAEGRAQVPVDQRTTLPPAGEEEAPTVPRISGATLARVQLQSSARAAVSQPGKSALEQTQRSAMPMPEPSALGERAPTYPPPPAVLDLDSLAAEVDGNSERPPPIRRVGVAEASLHLKPARVPTQLMDTLVSNQEGPDKKR